MRRIELIAILLLLLLCACSSDRTSTGTSILPTSDEILVYVDTFAVRSAQAGASAIISQPDSLLLGECDSPDQRFGTIHADILTQVACPESFEYPDGAWLESVDLYVYYSSWYGNGTSPMSIAVYELDKQTFNYSDLYPSDLDINDYWSGDKVTTCISKQEQVIVPSSTRDSIYLSSTSSYLPYIKIATTDEFAQKVFQIRDFSSQESFQNILKGLYITTEFGSANILYVRDIILTVRYGFSYRKMGAENDTTVYDVKAFYANSEVKKVNRIVYSDRDNSMLNDSLNYIVSPANMYAQIKIPIGEMSTDILNIIGSEKRPYVNRAKMQVNVVYDPSKASDKLTQEDWAKPSAYMMLAQKDSVDNHLSTHKIGDALISQLAQGTDSAGATIYTYSFDLVKILTKELRSRQAGYATSDTLQMVLVPVEPTIASSSNVVYYTAVSAKQTISTTTIKSTNSSQPMELEIVYSGF